MGGSPPPPVFWRFENGFLALGISWRSWRFLARLPSLDISWCFLVFLGVLSVILQFLAFLAKTSTKRRKSWHATVVMSRWLWPVALWWCGAVALRCYGTWLWAVTLAAAVALRLMLWRRGKMVLHKSSKINPETHLIFTSNRSWFFSMLLAFLALFGAGIQKTATNIFV